jgi:hypothetical protein
MLALSLPSSLHLPPSSPAPSLPPASASPLLESHVDIRIIMEARDEPRRAKRARTDDTNSDTHTPVSFITVGFRRVEVVGCSCRGREVLARHGRVGDGAVANGEQQATHHAPPRGRRIHLGVDWALSSVRWGVVQVERAALLVVDLHAHLCHHEASPPLVHFKRTLFKSLLSFKGRIEIPV